MSAQETCCTQRRDIYSEQRGFYKGYCRARGPGQEGLYNQDGLGNKRNVLCVAEDTLFQIYQLAIKKKVTQQFVLCIKLLEKAHPSETALHPLNRAKSSADQINILFLFTYVQLST